MTYLGRGRSQVTILDEYVVKKVPNMWEPTYMKVHPKTFVPVLRIGESCFQMPRCTEPDVPSDAYLALTDGLMQLEHLWAVPRPMPTRLSYWKEHLRRHLKLVARPVSLLVTDAFIDTLVDSLPEPEQRVYIHGDPTLANLVYYDKAKKWLWIDPLERIYIPGDIHVDLGKMLQSCAGYERVLVGLPPTWDGGLARTLVRMANEQHDVSYDVALRWMLVHFIRLLPYQQPEHQPIFLEVLRGHALGI